MDLREKIWICLKYFLSVDYSIIIDGFLDTLIISILAKFDCNEDEENNEKNKNLMTEK